MSFAAAGKTARVVYDCTCPACYCKKLFKTSQRKEDIMHKARFALLPAAALCLLALLGPTVGAQTPQPGFDRAVARRR